MADNRVVHKPQINISRTTSGRMWIVCSCSLLAVIQSALSDSGASLIMAACTLCAALLTELLITYKKHGFSKLKDGSAAASAMVFSLLLPNHLHPIYAVLGITFAMLVIKHSFGGLGSNWLNPSLGGFLFVRLSWPGIYNAALAGSPLHILGESVHSGNGVMDAPMKFIESNAGEGAIGTELGSAISTFLNNTVFSLTNSDIPAGYVDLLVLRAPGIIADRGLLALLIGTIIMTAFMIRRSWIPLAYLGFFSALVFVFGDLPFTGYYFSGDLLFALFSGGTITAAFILMLDPATGAKSQIGAIISAVLAALLTWIFRYYAFEIYGAFFAIALINTVTPLFRFIEGRFFYTRRTKTKGGSL